MVNFPAQRNLHRDGILAVTEVHDGNLPAATAQRAIEAARSLERLALERPVSPGADAVAIAQDRIREKAHFVRCGAECAPYAVIETADHLAAVPPDLLPGILKTARLGYDGKGQRRVATRAELESAWNEAGGVPCVLEKLLPLAFECSVIVARGEDGRMVNFPVQRNLHRDGILAVTEVHADNMPSETAQRAVAAAHSIAEGLSYVGVLCVEFFVLADGQLIVNEMAPRPHNSGHWTIDGCDLSQFDLQVRTLAGLPLHPPRQHSAALMLNLLGDLWFAGGGEPIEPRWAQVLALPGTHLHLYGKTEARRGRKMGHLNITGESVEAVRGTARRAGAVLGMTGPLTE
jgi:5-(carboxyamino)imidazole ribonucleotide synthase